MYIEEFLREAANEYSLSFSELKEMFLSEFTIHHNLNFKFICNFEKLQKFVKGLGIVTCGSVIYYLRNIELERRVDLEKRRNHEMKKRICETLFGKDDEIMKSLN